MLERGDVERGYESAGGVRRLGMRGRGDEGAKNALFVSEAVAFNVIPLREPAHADILVAVGRDDVLLVRGQEEGRQEGGMPRTKVQFEGFSCAVREPLMGVVPC